MIFKNGRFDPSGAGDERIESILDNATDRAHGKLRIADFLAEILKAGDANCITTLAQAMDDGASPQDLGELLDIQFPAAEVRGRFDGLPSSFSEDALAAMKQFESNLENANDAIRQQSVWLLSVCLLENLSADDRELLSILDVDKAIALLQCQLEVLQSPPPVLFDVRTQGLRSEEFHEAAWTILEYSAIRAAELGYDKLLPSHIFLALLGETEGVAEHLVRLQGAAMLAPGKVAEAVTEAFRLSDRRGQTMELVRDSVAEATVELLTAAHRTARSWGSERIGTAHLMLPLLNDVPPRLASVLQGYPLNMDLAKMGEHLEQYLREFGRDIEREVPFRLPPSLPPSKDLTYRARTNELSVLYHRDAMVPGSDDKSAEEYAEMVKNIAKALYRRRNNHVLITGLRGVGKTSVIHDLAARAAKGEFEFLKRKRFVWVDCRDVLAAESKRTLESLLASISGRTDIILCLDGFAGLLRAENGANNKVLLRAALSEQTSQLIGVMADQEFDDMLASDPEIMGFFTRVKVAEPDRDAALRIVRHVAREMEKSFRLTIANQAVDKAVILSSNYILNERLPSKAIRILERCCEDLDFERTQQDSENVRATVEGSDAVRVVSAISGVPAETLEGTGEEADYNANLSQSIIGQEDAVRAVADQLELIKGGLTSPRKPASVMLFAGLTGTGKTELAKALAEIYSASKQLNVYTMGNFTESHSGSGIIGVPPGYVGFEQGGRLINELNADPYSVFLLDEVEKAHPDIWKPFLNLFDEGWISDQRGVKAFADKSIFILTSNAGQETISNMTAQSRPIMEIIEKVSKELPNVTNDRGVKVFSPEFLARLKQIIIFRPLSREAMEGICRKMVARRRRDWKYDRGKDLSVQEGLINHIAEESDRRNKAADNKEGGRIVDKLISELIDLKIQKEAKKRKEEFRACDRIELEFMKAGGGSSVQVSVKFVSSKPPSSAESLARVATRLRAEMNRIADDSMAPSRRLSAHLADLHGDVEKWKAQGGADGQELPEALFESFRQICSDVERLTEGSSTELRKRFQQLAETIESTAERLDADGGQP